MFQFSALTPLLIIAITSVVLILVTAFYRNHKFIAGLSLTGLLIAFFSIFIISKTMPGWAGKLILIDGFSIFYFGLTLVAVILINIINYTYFKSVEEQKEEFYIMLHVSTLGTMVMISSVHFASFFLGLELLSIPLYVMIAYSRNTPFGVEAAIKYFILAGASSSILLFGMALIYYECGSMDIKYFIYTLQTTLHFPFLLKFGIGMIITALGFKLALAPFHMWTPDVYQGAPAPVTAFLSTASKGGAFAFAIRLFALINFETAGSIITVLSILAGLSMFTGNLLAIRQNNVKRILACSSIAHFGYLLIALISGGRIGVQAATFYLSVYFITTIGAFSVLTILAKNGKEKDNIEDLRGLYFRNRFLAVIMATMFFSLAGMPLTAGFMSKYYLASIGINANFWILIWLLIINSAIGLFYYLRVVYSIFRPSVENQKEEMVWVSVGGSFALAVSFIAVVWLGIAPGGLLDIISGSLK